MTAFVSTLSLSRNPPSFDAFALLEVLIPAWRSSKSGGMGSFMQESERRKAAIAAEIAALGPDHPWAGIYRSSMPLAYDGMVMAAPRSGYIEEMHHDCGGAQFPTFGGVVEGEGFVHFTSFLDETWTVAPVHWGGRHYLISEAGFLPFARSQCRHPVAFASANGGAISFARR